jgi:hypothetical protein
MRWTAHYLAYCRLLELRLTLQQIVAMDQQKAENKQLIITGDCKAIDKAKTMVNIIDDPLFWFQVARSVVHFYF